MRPDEARKLLGGYATGTLTEAEEQALFAAALEDQELFDELAREQALREVLRDPAAKANLLAALDEPRRKWWWSWKPAAAVLAMAGVAAVAVVVGTRKAPAPVTIVAKVEAPAPPQELVQPVPISPQSPPVLERRDAAVRPAAKRQFAPPAVSVKEAAPVELAEAPKVEAVNKTEAAPKALADAPIVTGIGDRAPGELTPQMQPPVQAFAPMLAESVARARIVAENRVSARALFQGSNANPVRVQPVAAQAAQSLTLGLRYSVVREGDQPPTLRITSNVNGYLSIGGATPISLTAMRPHTTEPLKGNEVRIVFARQPQTAATQPVVPLTEISGGDTYVVSPNGAPLSFTIPLKQQ